MAKFDHLKKSMGDFYLKNKNLQKKEIFRKFEGLGASKRTLNRWLNRLQKNTFEKELNGVASRPESIKNVHCGNPFQPH